jgi:hypothetical protein
MKMDVICKKDLSKVRFESQGKMWLIAERVVSHPSSAGLRAHDSREKLVARSASAPTAPLAGVMPPSTSQMAPLRRGVRCEKRAQDRLLSRAEMSRRCPQVVSATPMDLHARAIRLI